MKRILFKINDDVWKFSILSDEAYTRKHGKDSIAVTSIDICEVDFKKSELGLKVIKHELLHAHVKYMYLDSAKINQDSMEEIFAEFVSDRIDLLNKQAKTIYKRLK